MGIFNPFVSSCEHERNLDWILKRVKGMPQKDEMESALVELRNTLTKVLQIEKRADGLVTQVEEVIDDATSVAKQEIRNDLASSIGRIEEAERNTLAKAGEVQNAIDNATYVAKQEITDHVNSQLTTIRNLAGQVSENADYVQNVVSDATNVIKGEVTADINELSENLTTSVNEMRNNLSEEVSNKIEELDGRFTVGVVNIPVSAWVGNVANVNAGFTVDTTALFVSYAPESFNGWYSNGVRCVGANGTSLEFSCITTPTVELFVNVAAVANNSQEV